MAVINEIPVRAGFDDVALAQPVVVTMRRDVALTAARSIRQHLARRRKMWARDGSNGVDFWTLGSTRRAIEALNALLRAVDDG